MKKLIFSIIFIGISFVFFGQTTFNRVEDYYDTNRTAANYFRSVCSFDGSYFGAVRIYNQGTQYLGLVKLNNSGALVKKSLKESSKGNIVVYPNQTLISTSDSNIMICANLVDTSWDGYLIKINTNLDTLWTKVYDLPANLAGCTSGTNARNIFTAIKETPDKGFIIAGNYYKNCVHSASNLRSFLLRADSLGNVEWWKVYQNVAYLYDIELTNDGGYVFLNKYGFTKFTKTDSLGNIQWNSPASIYIGQAEAGDITPCGNNEFVVALPYKYDIQNNKSGINTFKINISTQQIIWDKTYYLYQDVHCISLNQNMGVEVNQSGEIIVWATAHVVESKGKRGAILKLNSQGDSLWAKYIVTDSIDLLWDDLQLNDLIITDDGGFMGVGYQWFGNSGQVMAWLFKTDSNGVIGWEESVPINFTKMKAYPNPTTDYITINIGQPLIQKSELIIYNSLGQIVKTLNLQKQQNEVEVYLQDFEIGVYIFELRAEEKVIGIGKFIKE